MASMMLAGCSLGPKFIDANYSAPQRVAVLPFANETNDVSGPEMVRKLLVEMLPSRGYKPVTKENVDTTLKEKFGITEGGQLGSVSPQELGKSLGVEGLFYGNILTFVDIPFGFGRKRTVKANVRLIEARSGRLLWEDRKSWTTPEVYLSAQDAKQAILRQVAERQIEKMAGTFLEKESRIVLELMLRNLPQRY